MRIFTGNPFPKPLERHIINSRTQAVKNPITITVLETGEIK